MLLLLLFIQYSGIFFFFVQIVDFSCGLNDFSQFMKEKLDKVGKKCNFKNYDIIRPKVKYVVPSIRSCLNE